MPSVFCTAAAPMIHQALGVLAPGWNDVDAAALEVALDAQAAPGVRRYLFEDEPSAPAHTGEVPGTVELDAHEWEDDAHELNGEPATAPRVRTPRRRPRTDGAASHAEGE